MKQDQTKRARAYPLCPECTAGVLYYDGIIREWVCPMCGSTRINLPVNWQSVED